MRPLFSLFYEKFVKIYIFGQELCTLQQRTQKIGLYRIFAGKHLDFFAIPRDETGKLFVKC